jgi:hypothetical protein
MESLGPPWICGRAATKKNELFLPGGGQKSCSPSPFFGVFFHSPIAPHPFHVTHTPMRTHAHVTRHAHPRPDCAPTPTPTRPRPHITHAHTHAQACTCTHIRTHTSHAPTCIAHTHTSHTHTHRSRPHHAHITHARMFLLSFRMPNLCSIPSKNHLFSNISKNSQK